MIDCGNRMNHLMKIELCIKGVIDCFFFLGLIVFMGCSLACVHACFF